MPPRSIQFECPQRCTFPAEMSDAEKRPDALTTRLREQLLLSQARIMELEDAREARHAGLAREAWLAV